MVLISIQVFATTVLLLGHLMVVVHNRWVGHA
jgi:hypothetical protein